MADAIQQKFFTELEKIYKAMDYLWIKTASAYGFKCTGCTDNCCETEFYHHTYIEKDYLVLKGMQSIEQKIRQKILSKAREVNAKRQRAEKANEQIRVMCPLNENNLCLLYKFRPMICRLHGIPHELHKPNSEPIISPGCHTGNKFFEKKGYIKFDRTPFYSKMAGIEMEYRKVTGKTKKIKQTIAQMLIS